MILITSEEIKTPTATLASLLTKETGIPDPSETVDSSILKVKTFF